LNKISRNRLLF